MKSILLAAVAALAIQSGAISYDDFMKTDASDRIARFNQITSENRAEIVKTHITRWRDANKSELSKDQLAIIEEQLALISPEMYSERRTEESMQKVRDLAERTSKLFTQDQMIRAFTIRGVYIPTGK